MIEPVMEQNPFQAVLARMQAQAGMTDALQKLRLKAWDHFLDLGLPTLKSEVFRYMKLRHFYANEYQLAEPAKVSPVDLEKHIYPECRQSVLVFINGQYRSELSRLDAIPKKAVISSMTDAYKTYSALLTNHFARTLKEETDPFAVLNQVLQRDGLFLYLPPKTVLETPIQILHFIDTPDAHRAVMPRIQCFVGTQSQIEVISTQAVIAGNAYWINQVTDFVIEDDAHVKYTHVSLNEPEDVWHLEAVRASLKRNSTFKTVNVTDGSQGVRNDYKVILNGENGDATLNGVWMLAGNREAHCHVLMDHQAPQCRSMQFFKGAVNDMARSSFEGKILVRQLAQQTNAFQLNNNLLLGERSMAYSKPNLEIFADDVKASHGSTVGQIDAEQLFYLQTRGFSVEEAQNLLVYGFCQEVIDLITVPSLLKVVSDYAKRYVTRG